MQSNDQIKTIYIYFLILILQNNLLWVSNYSSKCKGLIYEIVNKFYILIIIIKWNKCVISLSDILYYILYMYNNSGICVK